MKRLAAYILVLLHINFFMFTPQFEEQDVYDTWGSQQEDINSLAEYINEIILHNLDSTPDDEDDDSASDLNPAPLAYWRNIPAASVDKPLLLSASLTFSFVKEQKIASVHYDIIPPPPKMTPVYF